MRIGAVFSVAIFAAVASAAGAQPIAFERVADASSPATGWTEPLAFSAPASDAGRVAFHAYETLRRGAYIAHAGSVSLVADNSTIMPGGGSVFGSFYGSPAVSGDDVAFVASDVGGYASVHARIGGTLVTIVDRTTPEPTGGGLLNIDGYGPSLDGANLAFRAYDSGGWPGAYALLGGTLVTAADESTQLPGGTGSPYLSLSRPAIQGTSVAFRAVDPTASGLYVATGGAVRAVFDDDMSLPGSAVTGGYTEGSPSFRGGTVAFAAGSFDRSGIYAEMGGVLSVVADDTTAIPGGTGTFAWFGGPDWGRTAADGETVAFIGGPPIGPAGLYVRRGGVLHAVITTDAALDGKDISVLKIGPDAVDGNRIAFLVSFDDATQAIYVATLASPVPSLSFPATFALALGLLAAAGALRHDWPVWRNTWRDVAGAFRSSPR